MESERWHRAYWDAIRSNGAGPGVHLDDYSANLPQGELSQPSPSYVFTIHIIPA
jgi:hypothetical protein